MSFVADHLISLLRQSLPAAEQPALEPYAERARGLGGERRAEIRRALACARWATEVVAEPAHSGLLGAAARAGEAVKELGQAVWAELGADIENVVARLFPGKTGAEYLGMWVGVSDPDQAPGSGASPLVGPEIAWVLEAVDVARKVAETDGWAAVPWRRLLDEVTAVSS